jgi:hypothetical protein
MARTAKEDGTAYEDVGYGHMVPRKVFAGSSIPDYWEYDGATEGDTDTNMTLKRNKEAVERGDLDPASAHLGGLEAKAPEPTKFDPAKDLSDRNRLKRGPKPRNPDAGRSGAQHKEKE